MQTLMTKPISALATALLLLLVPSIVALSSAASPADFLRSACSASAYPAICVRSLSTYAGSAGRNPRQLAHVALTVSAVRAREAASYVSRLSSTRPGQPVARGPGRFQDCTAMMADSANRLRLSVGELNRLGRAGSPEFTLCLGNIQTWVSAALTDQSMCLASLPPVPIRGKADTAAEEIRKKVEEVSKVTGNALSFVNKIS